MYNSSNYFAYKNINTVQAGYSIRIKITPMWRHRPFAFQFFKYFLTILQSARLSKKLT